MPELKHGAASEEWIGVEQSAAADWLCAQPQIRAAVFFLAKSYGLIGFDAGTAAWKGTPGLETFMPFTLAEVRGALDTPKRVQQLMTALMEKHGRNTDQFSFRLGMKVLVDRGEVAMKELPGWGGRKDRWYALQDADFKDGEETEKTGRPRKRGLEIDNIVTLLATEGEKKGAEIVAAFPEVSRSVVYARLKEARIMGVVKQEGLNFSVPKKPVEKAAEEPDSGPPMPESPIA